MDSLSGDSLNQDLSVQLTLQIIYKYSYLVKVALNVTIVDQDLLFKKKVFLKMFMYTMDSAMGNLDKGLILIT